MEEDYEEIPGEVTKDPAFGMPAIWVPEERRAEAEQAGYAVIDPPTVIATHITEIIRSHAAEMLGRQEVSSILDVVKEHNPVLIDEVLNTAKLTYGQIEKVLQNLLQEKVSIRMRGRQMAHSELGLDVMKRFYELVKDNGTIEKQPQTEGRNIWMMLVPVKA